MAGRGPAPKPAHLRQRRNRKPGAAVLIVANPIPEGHIPPLEHARGATLHTATLEWWEDVWTSPVASEYLWSDVHGLTMLAHMIDQYWTSRDVKIAREIRMQCKAFGLTPLDRARLGAPMPATSR